MITDYMGGGVYRDPQKWLRNIWMTPNSNDEHPHHLLHADHLDVQGLQHPDPPGVRGGEKRIFGGSKTQQ